MFVATADTGVRFKLEEWAECLESIRNKTAIKVKLPENGSQIYADAMQAAITFD